MKKKLKITILNILGFIGIILAIIGIALLLYKLIQGL